LVVNERRGVHRIQFIHFAFVRDFEQDDLSTMLAFDVEEVLIQHGKGFLKS